MPISRSLLSSLRANRLLWSLTAANMNVTTDQEFAKAFAFTVAQGAAATAAVYVLGWALT